MPVDATAAAWFSVMRTYAAVISMPGQVVLDASAMRRVEPFGATVLALAVAQREHNGLPCGSWIPPGNDEVF